MLHSCGFCGRKSESNDVVALSQFSSAPLHGESCASTKDRGALMTIISSLRRSLRTGFEPRSGTRGENQGFDRSLMWYTKGTLQTIGNPWYTKYRYTKWFTICTPLLVAYMYLKYFVLRWKLLARCRTVPTDTVRYRYRIVPVPYQCNYTGLPYRTVFRCFAF